MTQRWKYIIGFSILLNVLLIGILIGKASSPIFPRFPPPPGMFDKSSPLRAVMEKTMMENRRLDKQIMALKHEINLSLSEKNIDQNKFEKLSNRLIELHNNKFKNMINNLFQTASQLPLEKRQQLVNELEHLPPPRPRGFK